MTTTSRDFISLWTGQTVSLIGSRITLFALPSLAILALDAGPLEVGLLEALLNVATPVLGLLVGAWVDRMRRRIVLIVTDLVRMALLGSVAFAYFAGWLQLPYLYIVALFFGVCDIFFNVAYQAYLPTLVPKEELLNANVRLEISNSGAQLAGPSLAGLIVNRFGSAVAVLIDAVSFAFSAFMLMLIRKPEPPRVKDPDSKGRLLSEVREGLVFVWRNKILRALMMASSVGNAGYGIVLAVLLLYAFHDLGLSPAVTGLALTLANVGFVISAIFSRRMVDRAGAGVVLLGSNLVFGVALAATPVASLGAPLVLLVATQFCVNISLPVYNIIARSLRQVVTPDDLQGRVNGTFRTVVWGAAPVGAILGGACGELFGVVPTIIIGGLVAVLSSAWLVPAHIRAITAIDQAAASVT